MESNPISETTKMKFISIVILFAVLLINPLSAHESTETLQQIQTLGKIRIGYRQFQPPMSFLGSDNEPAGYSIDICKEIVAEIKNKLGNDIAIEYVPVTAENRFQALIENKIDLLCGATSKTLSRSELVDFTQLILVTGTSFMMLHEKTIKHNFDGEKIGVVKGTTTADALKDLFNKIQANANTFLYHSVKEGLNALEKGRIDAFAADQVVLIGLVISDTKSNVFDKTPIKYKVLRDLFSYDPLALAVRKNDAEFRIIADRVISNLCASKKILSIYDKWFGKFSDTPPPVFEALVKFNAIPE